MQFGISINGDSPRSHNKLEAAVEAFLVELEDVEGITTNVTGWTHDHTSTRLLGHLPRELTADQEQEQSENVLPRRRGRQEQSEAALTNRRSGQEQTERRSGLEPAGDPTKLGHGEEWDATADATREAKKRRLNMADIQGTGVGGTVTKSDVIAHDAKAGGPESPNDPAKLAPGEKWDATDAASKEAKKSGVDMAEVEGTGQGGTVTKTDVEEHAKTE